MIYFTCMAGSASGQDKDLIPIFADRSRWVFLAQLWISCFNPVQKKFSLGDMRKAKSFCCCVLVVV